MSQLLLVTALCILAAGCGDEAAVPAGDATNDTNDAASDADSGLPFDAHLGDAPDVRADSSADVADAAPMDMGADAPDATDAPADSDATEGGDASPFTTAAFFGCSGKFVDLTGDGGTATIAFMDYAYSPSCARVKVGQKVTWSGAFASHPLKGATTNDPAGGVIASTSTGTSMSVVFTLAGYYGYYCDFHGDPTGASGTMSGNVEVVP